MPSKKQGEVLMRFRIQTDGDKFRVQKRVWHGWGIGAGETSLPDIHYYTMFADEPSARAWIRTHYGTEAEIAREWRTI